MNCRECDKKQLLMYIEEYGYFPICKHCPDISQDITDMSCEVVE